MVPLLVCSVVSVAVILERLWVVTTAARRSRRLQRAAADAWQEGGVPEITAVARRDDSPLGAVYRAVLALADADDEARSQVAQRQITASTRDSARNST